MMDTVTPRMAYIRHQQQWCVNGTALFKKLLFFGSKFILVVDNLLCLYVV